MKIIIKKLFHIPPLTDFKNLLAVKTMKVLKGLSKKEKELKKMTERKLVIYAWYGVQAVHETAKQDYKEEPTEETWFHLKCATNDYEEIQKLYKKAVKELNKLTNIPK